MSKEKDYKLRVFKSDLPELQERIQFLTGNTWELSFSIDGVEDQDNIDGRMVINKVPEDWPAEVVKAWIERKVATRQFVIGNLKKDIEHLNFMKDLVEKQIEQFHKDKETYKQD